MSAGFDRSRKTIIITHEFFPYRGGIATWVEEVAAAGIRLGYDLEVWCPADRELDPGAYPFPVVPMPVATGQGATQQRALARFLRSCPDRWRDAQLLLPEPGPIRAFMRGTVLGIAAPVRMRVVLHGTELIRLSGSVLQRGAFRRLLGAAERIVVVSRHNQTLLLDRFPELSARTRVVHAAPRTELRKVSAERAAASASATAMRVLSVGRISPRKGQLAVVTAIAKLPAALRERIEYRVVGQTNNELYRRLLVAVARLRGVHLVLRGKVNDAELEREYRAADVFAMTSMEYRGSIEGFGLVYLEAGMFGLPVLAHATGGVADAVVDGETGFLLQPDDRKGLAAALARFAGEPALRARMGQANATWARSFNWERTAEGVLG